MLRLPQCLIIYMFAVWTRKISDLACYLLKSVIPELPAPAPSLPAYGSNNELAVALRSFASLTSKVWFVAVLVIILLSAAEKRKQGEVCTQSLAHGWGKRRWPPRERRDYRELPNLRGCWVWCEKLQQGPGMDNELCRERQWDPVGAHGAGAMPKVLSKGGMWLQDQLEQIWACTAVERGSPAFQPTLFFVQDAFPRHTPWREPEC